MNREYLLNDIRGYDFLTNKLAEFKFTRPKIQYTITEPDLYRPDLVCIKGYGSVEAQNWWWIVYWYNEIFDVFNDIRLGDVLFLPNRLDIEEFVSQS